MAKENLETTSPKENLLGPLEIERKFLVKYLPKNWDKNPSEEILQGYLEINEDGSEKRLRKTGNKYEMGEKAGKGKIRVEAPPVELTQEEFDSLWPNTKRRIIEKNRYKISSGELIFELDIFLGKDQGGIMVEVEFKSDQDSLKFSPPDWFGDEVTDDERYNNKNIAQFGFPKKT